MSQKSNSYDSEIELVELFRALWSHKFFIALVTGLSIFVAGYNALTTEKKFTAHTLFQIENKNNNSGFNLTGELGALASIVGMPGMSDKSSSDILIERLTGREFIIKMKNENSLDLDPYFNSYNPNYKDPIWKAIIKKIIGWEKIEQEENVLIENKIISNYSDNVEIGQNKSGAFILSVTHSDPAKASKYANTFMDGVKRLIEEENAIAQSLRLNYLSETLADALQEMENAQRNLKDYAVKNSAMAQENFISESLKLDEIRMEKRKVAEIADLLSIIESFIKSGNLDSNSYDALRSSHPLVDDIQFRRILGMSETISAWVWPEIETIDAVSVTLRDRVKRLDVEIKNIEENAQIYATSAEDLAKYTREAKIAEATYRVLIEQVKSQALAAGFQPETFKVFAYATPPLAPSSPKRNLLLVLGAVAGIFLGSALALINAKRRGVYYSRSSLKSDANADLALKSKKIRRLARKSISDMTSLISNRPILELDEAAVKLTNKKIIYVLNSGGRPTASDAARLLATQSAQTGRNVVLCDTTGQSEKEINDKPTSNQSGLPIVSVGENICFMTGADGGSFFTSTSFNSTIKDLTDRFDKVFVCSSYKNAQLGLMALAEYVPGLVVISGLRKTRKFDIKNIKTRYPIDLLLYD